MQPDEGTELEIQLRVIKEVLPKGILKAKAVRMVVDSLIEVSAWASACAVNILRHYIQQRDSQDELDEDQLSKASASIEEIYVDDEPEHKESLIIKEPDFISHDGEEHEHLSPLELKLEGSQYSDDSSSSFA